MKKFLIGLLFVPLSIFANQLSYVSFPLAQTIAPNGSYDLDISSLHPNVTYSVCCTEELQPVVSADENLQTNSQSKNFIVNCGGGTCTIQSSTDIYPNPQDSMQYIRQVFAPKPAFNDSIPCIGTIPAKDGNKIKIVNLDDSTKLTIAGCVASAMITRR